MKKTIILSLIMLITWPIIRANAPILSINGEKIMRTLASITFDGDNATLIFADGDTSVVDMEAVLLTFGTDGIDDFGYYTHCGIMGDKIIVDGVTPGTIAQVFDAKGLLMAKAAAVTESIDIDASAFRPGIYLLCIGNRCIKLIKR